MNRQQYLLGKVAEEASELIQAALKAQQFGLDSIHPITDNSSTKDVVDEFTQLCAVMTMLEDEFMLSSTYSIDLDKAMQDRKDKVNKYFEITKELGLAQ